MLQKIRCLLGQHDWDGCTCRNCPTTRDAEHEADGCRCRRCRAVLEHMRPVRAAVLAAFSARSSSLQPHLENHGEWEWFQGRGGHPYPEPPSLDYRDTIDRCTELLASRMPAARIAALVDDVISRAPRKSDLRSRTVEYYGDSDTHQESCGFTETWSFVDPDWIIAEVAQIKEGT